MNSEAPRGHVTAHEWRWIAAAAAVILALSIGLNVVGYLARPDFHFAGMVYAWEDGQTYLAKIRQGMQGEWLYTLAYTADPSPPFFLYTNYLFLGHVAAWLQLGPDILFHAARLLGGAALLFTLYGFIARYFEDVSRRRLAFLLAAVGGGFGWLTVLLAHPTPDLLQPEMFPFLSILANVHFPLAMAALLWLFDLLITADPNNRLPIWARLIMGTLILATMAPYGLITIGAVGGLWVAAQYLTTRRIPRAPLARLIAVAAIAVPFLGLYAWGLGSNITLSGPDRQDLTLSPPPGDYLLAFGLVLVPALIALGMTARAGVRALMTEADNFLLITWIAVTLILIYLPFVTSQRRYSVALFVPIVILAVRGMDALPFLRRPATRFALVAISSLTNIVLLLVTYVALNAHAPSLFFTENEWSAMVFLRTSGAPHALVLTSPDLGLFIPPWTGQRVIYGHPVETLDAQLHKIEVSRFYSGTLANPETFLMPVDFVVVGPRERALGTPRLPPAFALVYTAGDVQVFARR